MYVKFILANISHFRKEYIFKFYATFCRIPFHVLCHICTYYIFLCRIFLIMCVVFFILFCSIFRRVRCLFTHSASSCFFSSRPLTFYLFSLLSISSSYLLSSFSLCALSFSSSFIYTKCLLNAYFPWLKEQKFRWCKHISVKSDFQNLKYYILLPSYHSEAFFSAF